MRAEPLAVVAVAVVAAVALVGLDHGTGGHGAGTFLVAWVLMSVATMLPTTLPLLAAFRKVTAGRRFRVVLVLAVVAGFLAVWTVAGAVAAAVDHGAHRLVAGAVPAALVGGLTLMLAGAYQWSELAARCLRACRTPAGFLRQHWTGSPRVLRRSARIGTAYGWSCLGCCAPLMTVMLVVGMGNLAWMGGLALVGAVQKAGRWGRPLARATGAALFAAGVVLVVAR